MRNKILLISDKQDQELFENVLQEFLQEGGELFFIEKKALALETLAKERPQLVFIDHQFFTDEREWKGSHCIVIYQEMPKTGLPNSLVRPLKGEDILEKCHQAFALQVSFPKIPPM